MLLLARLYGQRLTFLTKQLLWLLLFDRGIGIGSLASCQSLLPPLPFCLRWQTDHNDLRVCTVNTMLLRGQV